MWFLISILTAATAVGILYALHREAIAVPLQHVAALMFWRDAAGGSDQHHKAQAHRQFVRPWTFALLALICLLLASALNSFDSGSRPPRMVVIDIDEPMQWPIAGGQTLLDHAANEAFSTPATFIAAGDLPRLLATAADQPASARRQLDRVRNDTPVAANASAALIAAAHLLNTASDSTTIDWYTTNASVPDDVPPLIANRVRIHRQVPPNGRAAIVGVHFDADATNGRMLFRIARSDEHFQRPLTLRLTANGVTRNAAIRFGPANVETEITFDSIPSDGSTATAALGNESVTYQTVAIRLPSSPTIKVVTIGNVPVSLAAVADAFSDRGGTAHHIAIVDESSQPPRNADAVIRVIHSGPAIHAGEPLIGVKGPAIVDGLDFEEALAGDGPSVSIEGAIPLIRAGNAVLASYDAANKTNYLSTALVANSAEFPRRAAFPVFMTRAIRTLAGWTVPPPVVPASRVTLDPQWPSADALAIAVSDPLPRSPATLQSDDATPQLEPSVWPSSSTYFSITAIGLLTVEGVLFALGKIR